MFIMMNLVKLKQNENQEMLFNINYLYIPTNTTYIIASTLFWSIIFENVVSVHVYISNADDGPAVDGLVALKYIII